MTTLKDLLKLPALRPLKVLAGEAGLNHEVSYVTVMEVPDIERWMNGNDFILTSLYALKDDCASQIGLIEKLAKLDCAALAVKPSSWICSIDGEMLKEANKWGLPLLEIPEDVTYNALIYHCMERIVQHGDQDSEIERFYENILRANYDSPAIIRERAANLGLDVEGRSYQAIHLYAKDSSKQLRAFAKNLARRADQLLAPNYCPILYQKDGATIALVATSEAQLNAAIEKLLPAIDEWAERPDRTALSIGIGCIAESIDDFGRTIRTARWSQSFGNTHLSGQPADFRRCFPFYALLHDMAPGVLLETQRLATLLQKAGLVELLELSFMHNFDVQAVANALFIHKNTVRYRLEKVKQLTGLDPWNFQEAVALYTAILFSRNPH